MDKALRTTLMVLGILVLAALLFNFGIQLYWLLAGPAWGGYGPMIGPMMGGRAGCTPSGASDPAPDSSACCWGSA